MNERIKELAEQARKHFPKTEISGEFWVFDEQNFARLIIQECTDLFADQQNMIVNPNKPFAYRTVRALQENDRDTVRKIKTHFGVEP